MSLGGAVKPVGIYSLGRRSMLAYLSAAHYFEVIPWDCDGTI